MQEYDIDNFGWPHKKIKSQNIYEEKLLMQKVGVLTNKILKILKKDAIIDVKIKVNELN